MEILRQILCPSQLKLANQSPSVQPSSSSTRKNFFALLAHCSFHTDTVYRLAAASCFRLKTIQTGAFLDGEREGGRDAGKESWRSDDSSNSELILSKMLNQVVWTHSSAENTSTAADSGVQSGDTVTWRRDAVCSV